MNIKTRVKSMIKVQSGFTLIEVMIALVILAVGLLALATMQIVSIRSNAFSSEMTYATMLAQSRLEQIRNMEYDDLTPSSTTTDTVRASGDNAAALGKAYTVETTVSAEDEPAANMKTVTLQINWTGAPAGSATEDTEVLFTTQFSTVIKK